MKNGPPAVLVREQARSYAAHCCDRTFVVGASLLAKSPMPTPSASPGLRSGRH